MVAARAGAREVLAFDTDPFARTATALNAEANGITIRVLDALPPPAAIDLLLAGDVLYDPAPAAASLAALDGLRAAGIEIVVGDPGRRDLPLDRLEPLATYDVPEFGAAPGATVAATAYRYRP